MKDRNSHLLVGYWSRLRKGRHVPDQTDVDPRAIKRILPYVFILDASDVSRPLYRLAGTSHCDRYGTELKGTNFLSRWEPQSRNTLALLLKQSLASSQPVCLSSFASCGERGMVEIETVLAPLTFGGARATRFIGFSRALGDTTPLLGHAIAFERLVGSEFVCETAPLLPSDVLPPPAPPAVRPQTNAPHLRLVVSRDKAPTVHVEMDEVMKRLSDALEIVTARAVS
jgi:hypothetical protein